MGAIIAERLGLPYADGDDFHPTANIEKMAAGIPLTDEDRYPWLVIVAEWLAEHDHTGGVAACSALRRDYRERVLAIAPDVFFVHLAATREELLRRMTSRMGHFMPALLLDSQLEALQPLSPDEPGVTLDAMVSPNELANQAIDAWKLAHPQS
ncbi:gluconokinase [Nocardia camponoti]|uniref:Gluconokinase n=1 Tax=Nocardia camponoti TaxID=1616106 RepID=A0A917Q7F7_9NOCA|nr:gluconokinase [Nocardia camponoti]